MYLQVFFIFFPQLCTASVVVVSHLLPFHPGRYVQTVITVTFLSHPLLLINLISNQVCLRFKMRYGNWDVLLFPELSRVPIQEFKTQCFVTKDKDSPNLHSAAYHGPHLYYPDPARCNQLPVLTTFIPSLPQDSRFRVSVHSWEKPRPSLSIESHMEPEDVLLFEARIYVDGVFVA